VEESGAHLAVGEPQFPLKMHVEVARGDGQEPSLHGIDVQRLALCTHWEDCVCMYVCVCAHTLGCVAERSWRLTLEL
jgi:hypothetical protein